MSFFFGSAEGLFFFFLLHVGFLLVQPASDFLVTCVQVSHAVATLVAEHRLSTCVARA